MVSTFDDCVDFGRTVKKISVRQMSGTRKMAKTYSLRSPLEKAPRA
jgi:hypothetical protein